MDACGFVHQELRKQLWLLGWLWVSAWLLVGQLQLELAEDEGTTVCSMVLAAAAAGQTATAGLTT